MGVQNGDFNPFTRAPRALFEKLRAPLLSLAPVLPRDLGGSGMAGFFKRLLRKVSHPGVATVPKAVPMTPEALRTQIIEIVSDHTGLAPDRIKLEFRFVADLDCTDLEPVKIIFAIEEEFGIAISEQQAMDVLTVSDLVELVQHCLKDRGEWH